MTPSRWTRPVAALAIAAIAACATVQQPERTPRPNEVQVVEPAGREADWTYAPAVLAVAKGTTVTFVNRGKEFHTVTSDDPGRPFDISLLSNTSATFSFEKAGVFAYHCGVHPQMRATVRVCDGPCS